MIHWNAPPGLNKLNYMRYIVAELNMKKIRLQTGLGFFLAFFKHRSKLKNKLSPSRDFSRFSRVHCKLLMVYIAVTHKTSVQKQWWKCWVL